MKTFTKIEIILTVLDIKKPIIKKPIIGGIIVLVLGLLYPQIVPAQGTIYLSSLTEPSIGSVSVGSDSWLAAEFFTGTSVGGYILNYVQLGMADATGNPSGFTVMLYGAGGMGGVSPGSNLGTLSGSSDPLTSVIGLYIPTAKLTLSPSTSYFIVLTAGTVVPNGAFEWSESTNPPHISSWGMGNGILQSNDGISAWSSTPYLGIAQFAVTATAVPEPTVLSLLSICILVLCWRMMRPNTY